MSSSSHAVDPDVLRGGFLNTSPFVRGTVRGMLRRSWRDRLVGEFPQDGFTRTERPSGGPGRKEYRTDDLSLMEAGKEVPEGARHLTPLWRDLVTTLMSAESGRRSAN
ncbi:hypothetical protein [Streptomyces sp. NPDC001388]|uniref:hypothetical protein n=1 Tax=Streptomyces sp. NPDC001388 TaxID=3364568 RepID=UPI0036BF40DA